MKGPIRNWSTCAAGSGGRAPDAAAVCLCNGSLIPGISFDRLIELLGLWAQFLLATPVVLWGSWPFFVGLQSLKTRNLNIPALIGIGVGIAYVFSLVATALPDLFPPAYRDLGARGRYYEAAVITARTSGQDARTQGARFDFSALRALLELTSLVMKIFGNGDEREVPLDELATGNRLRVRPGDRVPVDGEIEEGSSAIDNPWSAASLCPDQTRGRPGYRRDHEPDRRLHRVPQCRQGHDAVQDRPDGCRGAAQPRADPAARGPRAGSFLRSWLLRSSPLGWAIWVPRQRTYALVNAIAVLVSPVLALGLPRRCR